MISQEERLLALENQIQDLLKWKNAFLSFSEQKLVRKNGVVSPPLLADGGKPSRSARNKLAKMAAANSADTAATAAPAGGEANNTKLLKPNRATEKVIEFVVQELPTPPQTPRQSATPSPDITGPAPSPLNQTVEVFQPIEACTELAFKIFDVIEKYGQHLTTDEPESHTGSRRAKFVPQINAQIAAGEAIRMILPSFPWKSINRIDKVLGALPDFGEELALARLNALCTDITKVYPRGAEVTVATDGLVFNDLVGISDKDTWEYSVALMKLAADQGFHNIKLVRVMDLLGMTSGREMSEELYMKTITACREELGRQFGKPDEAVRQMIESDPDTLMTYRGFIRFLETDLRYSPAATKATSGGHYRRIVKAVAMGMMSRAESFTKIILAKCPNYVRLSIHPSSGAVKVSVPLIPQVSGSFPKTPWHCSIAVGVDGSYSTIHAKDVRDTHTLVHKHGRPYFFREKSDLYEWAEGVAEWEHLYPGGVKLVPRRDVEGATILSNENQYKLHELAQRQRVYVQGFSNVKDGMIE